MSLAIALDCDSTLSTIEGIDELAGWAGCRAAVAELTSRAMDGQVPLEQVYGRRLDLIKPSRAQIDRLAQLYLAQLVPEAEETVALLRRRGVKVLIVSGGLAPALAPLARHLHIDTLYAVPISFDGAGNYAGLGASPLTTAAGKAEVLRAWRPAELQRLIMVGDGMSDLAAKAPGAADLFLAYGGVVQRPAVLQAADGVINNLAQLADYL